MLEERAAAQFMEKYRWIVGIGFEVAASQVQGQRQIAQLAGDSIEHWIGGLAIGAMAVEQANAF